MCLQGFDELDTVFTNKKKRSRGGAKTKASASSSRGINQANRKLKERKRSKLAVPRWCIPPDQLEKLEEIFADTPSPSFALRGELAEEFGATTRQVSIWFRNRRQRARL